MYIYIIIMPQSLQPNRHETDQNAFLSHLVTDSARTHARWTVALVLGGILSKIL